MYSPQPPQQQPPYQQPPYQQPPYGQGPYGQPPYGQPPYGQPPKDPNVGLLLELIGYVGVLGVGWIWAGETVTGVGLLIGWVVLGPIYALMSVVFCVCALPLLLAVPLTSGLILMNRLKARQAMMGWQTY